MVRTFSVNKKHSMRFEATSEGFKSLRRFILAARNNVHTAFTGNYVDCIDEIKDLNDGDSLFLLTFTNGCVVKKNIESVNAYESIIANDCDDKYKDDYKIHAYSSSYIKKTVRNYILYSLDYENHS